MNGAIHTRFVILLAICAGFGVAQAEDWTLPTYRGFAGAIWDSHYHRYFVESELRLPLLRADPLSLSYYYAETTPFLAVPLGGPQSELLYTRYVGELNWRISSLIRLGMVAGYRDVHWSDRTGRFGAAVLGAGIGSPLRSDGERIFWQVMGGGFLERNGLGADGWMDGSFSWRVVDFAREQYMESQYRASLALAVDAETMIDGEHIRGFYRVGPKLQLVTAYGNRASVELRWIHNEGNPFYGMDDTGLLFGLEVVSSFDAKNALRMRQAREPGWLPAVWGAYEVGVGDNRWLSRFEADVELVDFSVVDHLGTVIVWYESRQEYRRGDFDNIAYSVVLGVQTRLGLESVLSHGDPLVCGIDFFHRSDHSLNPDAGRVEATGRPQTVDGETVRFLRHGAQNLLPRIRLQTLGWDLPYRDPVIYEGAPRWLNQFDWRVTLGYDVSVENAHEHDVAAQFGLNWDVTSLQGCVIYARGMAAVGVETPVWLAELGVRRPAGKVFARYEYYDMVSDVARGNSLMVGVGFNL